MKRIALFLTIFVLVSMISGCTPKSKDISTTKTNNVEVVDSARTLRLCVDAAIETLDPHGTNNLNALWILKQMYEGLIYFNYEDDIVEPRIAKSYEMSDDGLTWTFFLRDDVKFHNGEILDASDVVFSYERAIASPVMNVYTRAIESVTAVDDKTVKIKLKNQVAPFLQYVSEICIVNKKFVEENNNDLDAKICGTGPYKADSIDKNLGIVASAFEDYYNGVANIKNVRCDVITDSAVSAMAFEAGELDYLKISYSQYNEMKANPNVTVGFVPSCHTIYVSFNCSKPPFNNPLVRKAICYMIDREAVAKVTFEGLADVDSLLMSPKLNGMPDYSVLEKYMYEYDPEKGISLLKEAGYDTAKEIDLGTIRTYPESHYASKPTLVIQENLAKYGIKLEIETMEVNAFVEALYGGDFTMACCAGSYGADASGYYQVFGSHGIGVVGGNPTFWSDPEVDELFEKGESETNPEERKRIYGRIMEILYEQAPGTGMAHRYQAVAWSKDLAPVLRMDYPLIYEWNFTKDK